MAKGKPTPTELRQSATIIKQNDDIQWWKSQAAAAETALAAEVKKNEGLKQDAMRAEKREQATREHFAELKARLLEARLLNERLSGYIARAQEDDVAREPLVATGDPDGESTLSPKRKHRIQLARLGEADEPPPDHGPHAYGLTGEMGAERRKPPRKWVAY